MLLRSLLALLLALNVAVGTWLWLGARHAAPGTASDHGIPLLHLLSERPDTPGADAAATTPNTVAPAPTATRTAMSGAPEATPAPASASTSAVRIASSVQPASVAVPAGASSTSGAATAAAPAAAKPNAKPATSVAAEMSVAVAGTSQAPVNTGKALAPISSTSLAGTASAARPASVAPTRAFSCVALGPFATQADLRAARLALQSQSARQRVRQEQVNQAHGWWVYLPASHSREQALAEAKRLSAHGIGDYFVVSIGGQPNTISLGLFKDPANARKRRDEVSRAGFPAQLIQRNETVPEYWLDLALADGARLEWRGRVHASGVGIRALGSRASAAGCF